MGLKNGSKGRGILEGITTIRATKGGFVVLMTASFEYAI